MVLTTKDLGRVRILTINRPQALNAMNNEVFAAIRDGLEEASCDDGIAVLVITGEGRAFSAGQDLSEANPVPSLMATKQLMLDAGRADAAIAAHEREMAAYVPLVGAPANTEAVDAFIEKRAPDFTSIPGI